MSLDLRRFAVVLIPSFIGWAACAAVMGVGMALTSISNALVIHAVAAPVIFSLLTLVYYKRFHITTPFQTATVSTGFVISADFFIVALLVQHSFAMFDSVLGTWLPFVLIFLSTYLTGYSATRGRRNFVPPSTVTMLSSH
jgi:hypothetical protein